ncbi:hypothetical protein KBZ12_13840 [Cyanobium sp. Cruz CV13-4-11]|uniref:hypothetical protein n=1 Tax=unclassified Cyanobium TaxID=2627006 RepID=UPI0020CBE2A2|nr:MULTISPECIES: hypothetical protein [unclassified Cyanobium]MCP9901515.1 hypothetical protein [Cyanobium sp. Cruz CV11-17]MCP9920538.1 hypothetical protein [Cyanobium sp. Cruz CV13-4-11]
MAETTANEAAQRYAVIEQAYSKEQWATVLQDGEELLQQLQASDNTQVVGLQMRLQLLLGHTQLYGYTERTAAVGYYAAVAAQSSEAALIRIAEQGLKQCAIAETPAVQATEAAATALIAPSSTSPAQAVSGAAAPWLSQSPATPAPSGDLETVVPTGEVPAVTPAAPWSEPSLIPDVVEEPELIELLQADPSLAEDVELAWQEPISATASQDKADEDLLRGLMLVSIG